jgi:hypothetical protein
MEVSIKCECGNFIQEKTTGTVRCQKCKVIYFYCYDKKDREFTWKKIKGDG